MTCQQKAGKGDKYDDPEDTFESFLDRFSELTQDIDRVTANVEELRLLQGKVLRDVRRDEAVDAKGPVTNDVRIFFWFWYPLAPYPLWHHGPLVYN